MRSILTEIGFKSDARFADSAAIRLATMLEVVDENGRQWLGMIGRGELEPWELAMVNLETWPELKTNLPGFLQGEFEFAKKSKAGDSFSCIFGELYT